ncbi:hypothetical protein Tco_1023780 [Tanacetum coccineum]
MIKWDPTNPKFEYCDDTELTNEKVSDLEDECSSDVDETAEIFMIEDNLLTTIHPCVKHSKNSTIFSKSTRNHKWYDKLTDGNLKEEALMHKARIEELWGDATPGVMKFCEWLKNSFENFHELDYDVLVKLEECWWKVNAHEKALFARWKNYDQGPYANAKTKKDYDHNLDNNANNVGDTQDTKKERHDPSVCNIRIFEMIKYSFGQDEEYVAIKEDEYEDLTSTSEDACRAYQEIFRMMDKG